jgi:nitrogen-specific signal transduction histidine kinase
MDEISPNHPGIQTIPEDIINSITEPLYFIDIDFSIYYQNKAGKGFAKHSQSDTINTKKCYEAIYGREDICPYCPLNSDTGIGDLNNTLEHIFPKDNTGKRESKFREILYKNKSHTQNLYLDFYPVERGNRLIGIVEKISDITSIKEKEEESLRMRNLASIGILVSGIAHELNNPLTGINLTLQNLQNSLHKVSLDFIEKRLDMIRNDVNLLQDQKKSNYRQEIFPIRSLKLKTM